jgi:hypothetical protein
MAQDTRERGLLMIEQAQWIINRLQDDLDLISMTRLPDDNPDESQTGPSGPELIDVDEITRLDDLEFTTPPAGSPTGVSTQPKTARTSGRASMPNPLSELIKIYDYDESSEVSLVTPVHIEEEKEPEKTSSLVPDAQTQGLPLNKKEFESVLDTHLPNTPKTQVDDPTNEPGSGEQKEEAPCQEIRVSTAKDHVSIEPTRDASISIGTQLPDE